MIISLLKTILFSSIISVFLISNKIYGKSIQTTTLDFPILPSKYTVDTITKLKIQNTCQTIFDCSDGALKCQNYGDVSYCIYPDYLCTNSVTCYPIQQTNFDAILSFSNSNESIFELIQENANKKYIVNSCFDLDHHEGMDQHGTTTTHNSVNPKCTVSVCSNDGECFSNECVPGEPCPMNLDKSTFYCNVGTNEYKCRTLVDLECQKENKDCSSSSTTTATNELKYVFISVITLSAIVLFAVILIFYNNKSKPIDESNITNVSSVVL